MVMHEMVLVWAEMDCCVPGVALIHQAQRIQWVDYGVAAAHEAVMRRAVLLYAGLQPQQTALEQTAAVATDTDS